jgi:hypothetical protein
MKKLCCLFGIVCVLSLLYSCKKDPVFDKNLLPGKWCQGTEFFRYMSDGNGYTWDEGDDVKEDEAQPFTWTLEKANLIQTHIGAMGQVIPKSYTVTELTSSSLKYKDDYGKSYSFQRMGE